MFGRPFHAARFCLVLGGVAMLLSLGCRRNAPPPPAEEKKTTETAPRPEDVLQQMVNVYKNAQTYQDQGVLQVALAEQGAQPAEQTPFEVAFDQSGKINIRAYQGRLVVDGKMLHGQIIDATSGNLDGQVLEAPAPEKLSTGNLLYDPLLAGSLGGRIGLLPPQIELLLREKPLQAFLDDKTSKQILPGISIDGRLCEGVQVTTDRGKFIFWVDRETHLLRRLQYPSVPTIADGQSVQATADFRGAAINENIDDAAFQFIVADNATRVSKLITPPQPLPTNLFARKPGEFSFHRIDGGKPVSFGSLLGKPQVLVWFNDFPGCQEFLSQLEQARKHLPDPKAAGFWAVCTEPSDRTNADLQALAKRWGLSMPVVRDLQTFGRDLFHIDLAPTLVVLDAKGRVQVFEKGSSPNLAKIVHVQLAPILERLTAGDDLAGAIVAQYEQDVAAYANALNAARVDGGSAALVALPQTSIAPRQDPAHLRLTPLWSRDDLESARSLLFVAGETPRFVVLTGNQAVVELDAAGKTITEQPLPLPEGVRITHLRAARDANNQLYYVAWSILGAQLYVFDHQWRLQMSYPAAEQRHEGIRDVRLVNLDGEGELEVAVGFWGAVGAQLVSLEGKRLWTNKRLTNILSVCTTPPNIVGWRQLLVTGDRGEIQPLNQFGKHDPAVRVAGRLIHHLYSADFSAEAATRYCGLSYSPDGRLLTIGLSETFEEVWSYQLPSGAHETAVELAASLDSPTLEQRLWMLAGSDGSLHFIRDDGDFSDYFQTGKPIHGAALAAAGGETLLVVANGKTVSAWRVALGDESK